MSADSHKDLTTDDVQNLILGVVVLVVGRCHYVIHRSEQQRATLHYPKTTLEIRVRWLLLFLVLVKALIMALTGTLSDKIKNL